MRIDKFLGVFGDYKQSIIMMREKIEIMSLMYFYKNFNMGREIDIADDSIYLYSGITC